MTSQDITEIESLSKLVEDAAIKLEAAKAFHMEKQRKLTTFLWDVHNKDVNKINALTLTPKPQ